MISISFKSVWANLAQLSVLGFLIPFAASLLIGLLFLFTVGSIASLNLLDPQQITQAGFGILGFFFVSTLIFVYSLTVSYVSTGHYLYWWHRGVPVSASSSLSRGFRRSFVLLGYSLLIYFATTFVMTFVIIIMGVIASAVGEVIGGILTLLVVLGVYAFIFWLATKLAFLSIAVAVAPRGQSSIQASMEISRDRFWATFGRQIVIGICAYVFYIVMFILVFVIIAIGSAVDSAGLAILLGLLMIFVFVFTLMLASSFAISGLTTMYIDRQGPSTSGPDSNV